SPTDIAPLPLHDALPIFGSPELVPSIDGRYVAAGAFASGLHKIDVDGALTWTSALAAGDRVLHSLRSVPTSDAGLMALLVPPDKIGRDTSELQSRENLVC